MRIRNLIVLMMVSFLVPLVAGVTYAFYHLQRTTLESGIDRELMTAAQMAKEVLPADYHDRIMGKDSISDAEYLQVVDRYNGICIQTGLEYLWSLMILDGKIVFTSGTSPGKDASKRDQASFLELHSNPGAYTITFESMQPHFEIIEDKWGRMRAVLIPHFDSRGRKYLIGASRRMEEIDAQLQGVLNSSLLLGGLSIGFGVLLSVIIANALARPIDSLKEAASRIAAGDYAGGTASSLKAVNFSEFTSLTNSFDLMRNAIRNREESLQKSEAQYRLLTENIKDVVWVLDTETMYFRYISPSVERLRGYTVEEIIHVPVADAVTPDVSDGLIDLIRVRTAAFINGEAGENIFYTNEVEQPCKDGSTVWTEVVTNYYRNPENGHIEVRGVTRDITDRIRAEKSLRSTEKRFREIFQNVPSIAVQGYKMDGTTIYWNHASESLYGYTAEEALGKNLMELIIPPEMRGGVEEAIRQMVSSGQAIPVAELSLMRKDGSQVAVYSSHAVVSVPDQELELFCMDIDITDRKKAEERLLDNQKKLADIVEFLPDATLGIDQDKRVIFWNQAMVKMTGIPAREMIGKGDHAYTVPFYGEARPQIMDLILTEDQRGVEHYPGLIREGDTLMAEVFCDALYEKKGAWVYVKATPLYDSHGNVVGAIETIRDISERKVAEEKIQSTQDALRQLLAETEMARKALLSVVEDQKAAEDLIRRLNAELERRVQDRTAQLETVNHELEAFAYSVSHDLRAPLRAMDGFSGVLLADYKDKLDEQGQDYLRRIQVASRRLGLLINDLLNLSRVTRTQFIRQQVDLSRLAGEIAAELQAQDVQRRVNFEIEGNMIVAGDAHLLTIMLENLINNAYKFTGQREQAQIQVGVTEQAGERVYFVRDNGAGFDMAYANRLFAPFQRLHAAHEFPGTGIGLATVQRIVTRHGGRIWPEAVLNQGTTFYFTLGE